MELLLVRHGHAGSRRGWHGDDRLRPLDARGRLEALAVADALAGYEPRTIWSSPYLRCLETVQPLARCMGVEIGETELLAPDAGRQGTAFLRALLREGTGAVAVSTHGETIELLQASFGHPSGAKSARATFRPGSLHEKGSTWVLRATGGRLTGAEYLPPGESARGRTHVR